MADGLNKVILVGNLGQDPELRATPGGQSILKLSLGINESYLDRNNVRQEKVEWVRCTVWGKRAEGLAKILGKGDKICVEGKLHTSKYEKNGEARYSTEVNVTGVYLCGSKRGGEASDGGEPHAPRESRRQAPAQTFGSSPPDDDIPF